METGEAQETRHRYLNMTEYWIWRDKEEGAKSAKTNESEKEAT